MEQKEKVKYSYETLWKFIIRPPRDDYDEDNLGHPVFMFKGKTFLRKDYDLISSEGYIMKCSFFEPDEMYRPSQIMPVVLYLHGNSSSRLEGIGMLKELLKRDINLFVVDFPGCGLSEGEYISLGYHESHDVKILVDFIEKLPGVGYIGLWGRSMGAATTMIYSHTDDRIKAIVMDSPFADFSLLAKELVLKQIKLPNFLVEGALKIIKMTVKKKNGLDIEKLKPIESAPLTTQPAIFIHANSDELIDNKHSEMLIKEYKGKDVVLRRCDGKHNTRRPAKLIREVGEFFYKHLVNDYHENFTKTNTNKENSSKVPDLFDLINNDQASNNTSTQISEESKENGGTLNNNIEGEEHLSKRDEKKEKEMESMMHELSTSLKNSANNKQNIDINNDFDKSKEHNINKSNGADEKNK